MNHKDTENTKPETLKQERFRQKIVRAAEFVQANQHRISIPDVVPQHPDSLIPATERLLQSLVFHAMQGTLAVASAKPGEPLGLAIAWQCNEADVRAAQAAGRDVFQWKATNPKGDCVYLGLVITREGIGPEAVRVLAGYFLKRFPHWPQLKQFAHRQGRLREYRNLLQRLAGLNSQPT